MFTGPLALLLCSLRIGPDPGKGLPEPQGGFCQAASHLRGQVPLNWGGGEGSAAGSQPCGAHSRAALTEDSHKVLLSPAISRSQEETPNLGMVPPPTPLLG